MTMPAGKSNLGPGGVESCSQGREPLVDADPTTSKPRRGDIAAANCFDVAPLGLCNHANVTNQGLAPLATRRGPSRAIGRRCNSSPPPGKHRAFTLLEVILALVILAAALATFGEIMQLANRNAVNARAETQAQILAESLMDELLAGVVDVTQVTRQPLEVDSATPWVYSVTIGTSDLVGVQPVEVLVEQDVEPQFNPVKFRLLRWLPTYIEMPESGAATGGGQQSSGGQGSNGATGGGTTP